jgi:hypothetical protein
VVTSGATSISERFRHALTPETQVFSWQGHLEAEDFDPPHLADWVWDAERRALAVTARDPSGVAWVRARYEIAEETRVKDLELVDGGAIEGTWLTPFPLGERVRRATIEASDAVFNSTSIAIDW